MYIALLRRFCVCIRIRVRKHIKFVCYCGNFFFFYIYIVALCYTRVYIVLYSVDFMYKVCVASICVVLEFTLSCIASILCALFNVYGILEYTLLYIVSILCTLFVLHQFVLKCTLSCNVSILLICVLVLYNLA